MRKKRAITELHQRLDFETLSDFANLYSASEMNSRRKTALHRRLLKIFFDPTNALLSGT
jgi:hypothetical protein